MSNLPRIRSDHPATPASALEDDKLRRGGFAAAAVDALRRVSSSAGFVISIEGPWGCGKSTILAMMEQLLRAKGAEPCTIVHFNPWLVGDREALLNQFLGAMAKAVELGDSGKNARKVSKELKDYSQVFGLLKFVPGAEPWASIIKGVMQSAGSAAEGYAHQKSLDIEAQKRALERALETLDRKIYVFIDDVDRLYPTEVFEMVRIIKAIGDLPNVGYVVAWDATYITRSLEGASVPLAEAYVDKVIQVRLPVPVLSAHAKRVLLNEGLNTLPAEALAPLFPKQVERLGSLYYFGLADLLEQPRDVIRLMNTVSVIEPGLRGEVVLADIIGLVALMLRAPAVYAALRNDASVFTSAPSAENHEKQRHQATQQAFFGPLMEQSSNPSAARKLTGFLFPAVAKSLGSYAVGPIDMEGHVAAPSRLGIALGLAIGDTDASLTNARHYMSQPERREAIAQSLTADNAMAFLDILQDASSVVFHAQVPDVQTLCVDIARLIERPPLSQVDRHGEVFFVRPDESAMDTIRRLLTSTKFGMQRAANQLAGDAHALTIAAHIVSNGIDHPNDPDLVICDARHQAAASRKFVSNVVAAIEQGRFWSLCNPERALWSLMRLGPGPGKRVFKALQKDDPTLDRFALIFLKHSFSSAGGQSYRLPKDAAVDNLLHRKTFVALAKRRLKDDSVTFPLRAAWLSVVQDKALFGSDGSDARR